MTDGVRPDERSLKPILSRLREIERKCSAMGSRNEEFPLMEERVASLINRLEAATTEPERRPRFGDMARELFAVAHLFESLGFISVGREIAHIERALRALDPSPDASDSTAPPAGVSPSRGHVPGGPATDRAAPSPSGQLEEHDAPRRPPTPVIVGFTVLALAVLAAASIILGIGPLGALLSGKPAVERVSTAAEPVPTLSAIPSPSLRSAVVITPTPPPNPEVGRRRQFAEALSQARLALARQRLDAASEHLSEAARFDRTDDDVTEIAHGLFAAYLAAAGAAADAADWTAASDHLERARRIALRFGLDEGDVRAAGDRIAAMERFTWVTPDQRATLGQTVGQRVEVHLRDGGVYSGTVDGMDGSTLRLEMVREVAGGGLTYVEEVPLSDVARVKVFER